MSDAKKTELAATEDRTWTELSGLLQGLSLEQMEEKGYYPEWSVKDVVGHIGAWMAEAGNRLERVRMGTYTPEPYDVDELNARFHEALQNQPLPIVRAEAWSSRNRMLEEWDRLDEITPEAEDWFVESGAEHYEEHLPRLREWTKQLGSD